MSADAEYPRPDGRPTQPPRWELAAETIAVRIRWFGLLVGTVLANWTGREPVALNAILAVGATFTAFDTYQSLRGRVFLGGVPLVVSAMEALFVGLLCYFHDGLDSYFRYYYFMSLVCCAIRHPAQVTYLTCAFHCASFSLLYLALPTDARRPASLVLTLVVLGWVSWAGTALAGLLRVVGEELRQVNGALRENQAQLEERIAERTRELQESQAQVLHQEKMAAFGLLAAGIAHEVGNPLTSISSLVQILQRRDPDPYTAEKLALVSGQLRRIQGTLRELIDFGRPASSERTRFALADLMAEALNIAKYYKRTKNRVIEADLSADLPPLIGVRDQLVQVFLNLILNAIDATGKGGRIALTAVVVAEDGGAGRTLTVTVRDEGAGIPPGQMAKLFQPYFTTKPHGTGLGLFVTRKLVGLHGGTVECRSEEGAGTAFVVRLPVPSAAACAGGTVCPVLGGGATCSRSSCVEITQPVPAEAQAVPDAVGCPKLPLVEGY